MKPERALLEPSTLKRTSALPKLDHLLHRYMALVVGTGINLLGMAVLEISEQLFRLSELVCLEAAKSALAI